MRARALFLVALLAWGAASADEATRRGKIAEIFEIQGLSQMLQQQMEESKAAAGEIGKSIVKKILAEKGIPEGQQNPQLEQVFRDYLERSATMFSAKELVDTWSTFYGENLSESELDQVLAYYKSPVGRKDVIANQLAMPRFGEFMRTQQQKRMNASIGQFMAEVKSALAK